MSLLSALLRRARPSHMIWARSILHQTSLRLSSTSAAAGTSAPAPSAAPNATGTPRNLLGSLVLPTANRRVSTDPKVLSSFLFWLAQRGADFRHVDVRPIGAAKSAAFSGNWGVFAAKDCVAGEVLARLPLKCTVGTNFDPRLFEAKKEEKADKVKDATPNPLALAAAIGNDVAAQQADSYEESFQTLLSLLPVELNELKMGLRLLAERCRPYEKHSRFVDDSNICGLIFFGCACFFLNHFFCTTAFGRTLAHCRCTFPEFPSFSPLSNWPSFNIPTFRYHIFILRPAPFFAFSHCTPNACRLKSSDVVWCCCDWRK
jgi:hypothetical protein